MLVWKPDVDHCVHRAVESESESEGIFKWSRSR
jgi:hypothetical protein